MAQHKTIRGEIRNLAVVSVALALTITFLFSAFYTASSARHKAVLELETLARITALNSQSALLFDDGKVSEENLNALAPRRDIVAAEIVTRKGVTLARMVFGSNGSKENSTRLTERAVRFLVVTFGGDFLVTIEQPVIIDGTPLGKVRLEADFTPVWMGILYSLGTFIGAMVLALLLSTFLAHRLLGNIILPIERLGNSAKNIARTRQYSLRVEKLVDDELGVMTDQFNLMLEEVEKRDQELLDKSNFLEQEVQSRTGTIRNAMGEMYSLLNSMAEGAYGIDTKGHCKFVNASFLRILGYAHADEVIGKNTHELFHHSYPDGSPYPVSECKIYDTFRTGQGCNVSDEVFWRKDGVAVAVEYRSRPLVVGGEVQGAIATFIDITERKKAEAELKIAAAAFESQEGILVTDAHGLILRVNGAFTRITGYTAAEVMGKNPNMLASGRHDADFFAEMWGSIHRAGSWEGEIWNQRKNGDVYPEYLIITAVKGVDGIVTNYVGTLTDITLRKAAEEEIQRLAFFDPLTGLPNRRLLLDRLSQALASSARSGREGALLFIDLDHFKTLNDTLGHDVGDMLLQQVAERLTACVREGDTVARLGGDEFVVMLEDLSELPIEAAAQTEAVGDKILSTLNRLYQLSSHEYHNTPSIGATLFNHHQQGADDLFKQADIAMYQAKKAGRNTLRFFDPQMQASITARVALESDLRNALEKQQFQLYYQIQVDSAHRPLGAEALIRWPHPERGLVSPVQFIPLAEETGLILPIGQWVMETACAQIGAWQREAPTRDLVLSVNISAKQLRQPDFVAQVHAAVRRHAINPLGLKLELTESMLLESVEETIATMNALNEIGVRFSLDDFGTGYSSLQYLKRLPLCQLKIDQSFVCDIADDGSDKAIVRTIIAMAQSLNLEVIAEGVETEEQREILLSNGCTNYQGYLFGKPVPIEQFEASLKSGGSDSSRP